MNVILKRVSHIFFLGLFFLLFSSTVYADSCPNQSQPNSDPCWFIKSSMPIVRRELRAASDANGNIYVVGGYDGTGPSTGFKNNLELYNPLTDSWSEKNPAPVGRNSMGFTFDQFNGKFYAAGGFNEGYFSDLYEYAPTTDTWTQKASFTYPRAFFELVTAQNEKLYAIGGQDGSPTLVSAVEEYNPTTDSWTTKTSLPTPRTGPGVIAATNGKIYVIGGHTGDGTGLGLVEEYNPTTDSWTTKNSMPTGRSNFGLTLNAHGTFYAIGGFISSLKTDAVEEYNPYTDTWISKTSIPTATAQLATTLGNDNEVHVIGGITDSSVAVDTNYGGLDSALTNQPPVIGTFTAPSDPVIVNTILNISTTFSDPNINDTHTAVWSWGNNTTSNGTIAETNGSGNVSGTHTYTTAGVYTVGLTVTDNHNASANATYQYIVVYDPSAGFITASGKYNSLAGWDLQNTQATGEVKFGIQAKYTNNNTTPTGNSKLNFNVGNIDFNSTSYQWLAVNNAKGYLMGNGTVNGTGNYTIFVSVIDGSQSGGQDLIRIRITDTSTQNPIYDTQPGLSQLADPTTTLIQGSIKIH